MVLVLNLGLKSIRAIVFDIEGNKLSFAARSVTTILKGRRVEQDPEDWWRLGIEAMTEALEEKEVRDAVTAITVTTSSCCLVGIDVDGKSVMNSMMVADKRSYKEAELIEKSAHYLAAKAANNNYLAHPSMMLPKAMWLKANDPEAYAATSCFLGSNDFLIHRICGELVTDTLNAEKFYFSPDKMSYETEIFEEFGMDKILPRVVTPGTDLGECLDSFKDLIGVKASQSVRCVVTTYDAICAFFGSGLHKDGDASDVSGTVTSLRVLSKTKPLHAPEGIFVQHEPLTGVYIIGGSNNLGGGLIEWAKQSLFENEELPYERMEQEARNSILGARGVVFLPYLLGERAPIWDDEARAVFFGIERFHKREDMIRAVFESTGLSLVPLMNLIASSGCRPRRLLASGGLSRMSLISEVKADVLDVEVCLPNEFETTAVGAHILVAIGLGFYKDLDEASKIVSMREIILPDKKRNAKYMEIYEIFNELYTSLKPLFVKRRKMLKSISSEKSIHIENL